MSQRYACLTTQRPWCLTSQRLCFLPCVWLVRDLIFLRVSDLSEPSSFLESHASLVLTLSVTPSVCLSVFCHTFQDLVNPSISCYPSKHVPQFFPSCHMLSKIVTSCLKSSQVVTSGHRFSLFVSSCCKMSQVVTSCWKSSQVIKSSQFNKNHKLSQAVTSWHKLSKLDTSCQMSTKVVKIQHKLLQETAWNVISRRK